MQLPLESSVENPNQSPSKKPQEETGVSVVVLKRRSGQRKWCSEHAEVVRAWKARAYLKSKAKGETPEHRAKRLAYKNKWNTQNRHKQRAYETKKRREDHNYVFMRRLRARQQCAFESQRLKKSSKTMVILGCTIDEAKAHISSQFKPGMSWDNRESFCIDHVVPIAVFDLRDAEEVALAFNWRNLQPLTHHENHIKYTTLPDPLPAWLPPHIAQRIKSRLP